MIKTQLATRRIAFAAALATIGIGSAHAEAFGLLNGRSADPGSLPPLSVEGGFVAGDLYETLGLRVNYRLTPDLVLYGDLGLVEVGRADEETGYGVGVFYFLAFQQMLPGQDVALKASYHLASAEFDELVDPDPTDDDPALVSRSASVDYDSVALEVLVSSRDPIAENGVSWYLNGGVNIIGGGNADSTELLVGGGAYMPFGPGEVYGGIDFVDELQFGVGYRYFVR